MINLSGIPDIDKNEPADSLEIQEIENSMGITLPNTYKQLLTYANGFSISGGLVIYGTDDLLERNETWEVKRYAEGYIAIGDDGEGNVFLISLNSKESEIFIVDAGYMNPRQATVITTNLIEWVNSGCIVKDNIVLSEIPNTCNIVLVKQPSGGLKELLRIKQSLGIDISTAEILKGSKNLPFILVENFPYGKAKKTIEKIGDISKCLNIIPTN